MLTSRLSKAGRAMMKNFLISDGETGCMPRGIRVQGQDERLASTHAQEERQHKVHSFCCNQVDGTGQISRYGRPQNTKAEHMQEGNGKG